MGILPEMETSAESRTNFDLMNKLARAGAGSLDLDQLDLDNVKLNS
jgi:hypothetical protein